MKPPISLFILLAVISMAACDSADHISVAPEVGTVVPLAGDGLAGATTDTARGARREYEGAPPEIPPLRDVYVFVEHAEGSAIVTILAIPFDESVEVRYRSGENRSRSSMDQFPHVARRTSNSYRIEERMRGDTMTFWIRLEWVNEFYQYHQIVVRSNNYVR